MICYLDSCRDKTLKLCSPEKFRELTESQRTAMLIESYRSGQNPDAKSQLSAFVFMGYDEKMLATGYGSRKKSDLKPTGLVMFDFDHVSKTVISDEGTMTPYDLYDRFLKLMPHFGFTLENDLALAHVTPSGDGLRIVMKIRKGKTIAETQERVGKMLGIECDKAVKDLSRLSFCPTASDILYINKSLLFQTINNNSNESNGNNTANNSETQHVAAAADGNAQGAAQTETAGEAPEGQPGIEEHGIGRAGLADSGTESESRRVGEGSEETQNQGESESQNQGNTGMMSHTDFTDNKDNLKPESWNMEPGTSGGFPPTYKGVKYTDIVEKWIALRGGKPEPGDRHATLVELAMDLRKICDNNRDWIASLMPDFDKGEEEKLDAIDWAVGRSHSKVSGTLKEVLLQFGIKDSAGEAPSLDNDKKEDLPPEMPEKLPRLVELLTSKVLPHQRAAVCQMSFPALATHVNNCQFKLRDNTATELSLMCCLFAPQSVGKGCVKPVLKHIMADIRAEDKVNRQREHDWQESQKNKKANEKGKSKPEDIVVRILSSDTTPAAFLGRLFAAEKGDGTFKNLCTYSQVDEIEDLYRFCQSGGRNMVQQMIKRTWDRDDIGAERFTANAANFSTVLRWNWAASSTIEGGKKFFRHCLTDGTTSRVDFCTIIQPNQVIKEFAYGDYDKQFRNELRPYIDNLKLFACEVDEDGEVVPKVFPEVRAIEEKMNDYINTKASTMPDSTWENYAWRAKVMAIKKLIVLYIANGQQWEDTFEPFIWWTFEYNMWCKMNLFYDAASAAFQDERLQGDKGHKSPLKFMSRTFTFNEFATMCQQQGLKLKPDAILRKYKFRGVVIFNEDKTYTVTANYAKKFGIV